MTGVSEHNVAGQYVVGPHLIEIAAGQVCAYPDSYTLTAWAGQDWTVTPFMTGSQVTYNDKVWVSLIDYNVAAPGESGWREVVSEGYPAWIQPTGAHDAYGIGERVSFEGADYESLIPDNVWSPSAYPAGWQVLP